METGEKIRLQRIEKDMATKELADRTKIDIEQLLKIESGEIAASLGTLIKVSRVLGVRLGTFLDDREEDGAVLTRKGDNIPSVHFAASGLGKHEHLAFTSLAREKSNRHMDPFLVEILPEAPVEGLFSSHEGEEFVFVLSGTIEVSYGQEKHLLNKGDSIYYDSIVGHRIQAVDGQKALILAVVYLPV